MRAVQDIRERRYVGFTLVELMVVVAILGILAAVVALNVGGQTYKACLSRVKTDMKVIESALEQYKMDMFTFPDELQHLVTAPPEDDQGRWTGPYIKGGGVPLDPWGNPYQYTKSTGASGAGFDLKSLGADGQPGGTEREAKDLTLQELLYGGDSSTGGGLGGGNY